MNNLTFKIRLYANKAFWGIVSPVRRIYWRLFHPKTRGVKLVIVYDNEVILVRPNYGHGLWTFPGGGVKRNEEWKAAALREAQEETNLSFSAAEKIGEFTNVFEHKFDTVQIFQTHAASKLEPKADGIEIAEAKWFSLGQLPTDRSPRIDTLVSMIK